MMQFDTATEMRAHYKAVRLRLFGAPKRMERPQRETLPPPELVRPAWAPPTRPAWVPPVVVMMTSSRFRSIARVVAHHRGLSTEEMLGPRRTQLIAWARQDAMYLCREITGASYPQVGRMLGGRDHTTVLHACRAVLGRMAASSQYREEVDAMLDEASNLCRPATVDSNQGEAR